MRLSRLFRGEIEVVITLVLNESMCWDNIPLSPKPYQYARGGPIGKALRKLCDAYRILMTVVFYCCGDVWG